MLDRLNIPTQSYSVGSPGYFGALFLRLFIYLFIYFSDTSTVPSARSEAPLPAPVWNLQLQEESILSGVIYQASQRAGFSRGRTKLNKKREREKRSLNNLPFAATDTYLITHAHLAADAVLASLVQAIFTPFVSFEEPSGPAGLQWFTISRRTGCPQREGGRKREGGGRVQLNKQVVCLRWSDCWNTAPQS